MIRANTSAVFAVMCAVAACSSPRIDTSSDEALQSSVERVRQSLPEEQRDDFNEALQEIAFADLTLDALVAEGATDGLNLFSARLKEKIAGRTGREIIAQADSLRAEREERQRQQALQEIAELVAKQDSADTAREMLAQFEVVRSRSRQRENSLGITEPIIELTVRNGTEHAVSRAFFRGTLQSPGRSIPWISDEFNYRIRGGLEPGEEASWRLAPNMFSDWGKLDPPVDAVFTVEVVRLDGPDGEGLFDSRGLSEYEEDRLEQLVEEYGLPTGG